MRGKGVQVWRAPGKLLPGHEHERPAASHHVPQTPKRMHAGFCPSQALPIRQPTDLLTASSCQPPPQYTTQSHADFSQRVQAEAPAVRQQPKAGLPGAQNPGYNIITGSASQYGNHAFERWDGRDYRRHR